MEKINPRLMNDLTSYFRYRKSFIYQSLFDTKKNKANIKTKKMYYLNLDFIFDKFNEPLNKALISPNKQNEKAIGKKVKGNTYYFNKGFKITDFFNLLNSNKKLNSRVERLSKCYDVFEKVDTVYRTSGWDQVEIETNTRYVQLLKKTFMRFGANPHCVVLKDNVKDFEVIYEDPEDVAKRRGNR